MKKLQKKMAALYAQQQKKGGIIDVEQERNRFLIGISSVRWQRDYATVHFSLLSSQVLKLDTGEGV